MPTDISIEIPDDLRDGIRALKPVYALGAIQRGQEKGTAAMVGEITRNRLTGKGPFPVNERKLGVVTGRLRRSFRWSGMARVSGNVVTTQLGASVEYAAAHEFGFKGAVTVKAHSRKTKKGSHSVKGHARKVNIPERMPIRTGIAESSGLMTEAIAMEVVKELERKD